MNKNLYPIFLIIFTAIFTVPAKAQQHDFVITNNGDTVQCKLKFAFFGGAPSYQTDTLGEFIKIKSDKIRYFRSFKDGKTRRAAKAVYINGSKKRRFIDIVQEGEIMMYKMVQTGYNYVQTTTWYAAKGTDTLTELKTSAILATTSRKSRKEFLKDILKDKPEIYDKYVADDSFSFAAIGDLIYLYNTTPPIKRSAWKLEY
ncbi:MAG: hypothetical protein EOP47_26045 [Sphingobacteriaceae bacterium]|nr:MAG: hypothetical protein EOP47_26045 [Sphingobacteriaceae bacterium]